MKLLHVGLFDQNDPQVGLRTALKSISDVYNEVAWKFHNDVNGFIVDNIDRFDVVFINIQNPFVIHLDTVQKLYDKGVLVFNFTGDVRDPLPKWYIELAPYVVTLFTNQKDVDTLVKAGFESYYFPSGYDQRIYNLEKKTNLIDSTPIVFMGNNLDRMNFPLSDYRKRVVSFLRETYGTAFGLFGGGWDDANAMNLNFQQEQEAEIYRHCKVAINLSNFNYDRYTSDRMFRIMGSGAFCLSHHYDGIEKDFTIGTHLGVFHNLKQLKEAIDDLLYADDLRKKIARKGYDLVSNYYTWDFRINNQLLDIISKKLSKKFTEGTNGEKTESGIEPCKYRHKVNNGTPTVESVGEKEVPCDCGKIIFYTEMCGCQIDNHLVVRDKPNENV